MTRAARAVAALAALAAAAGLTWACRRPARAESPALAELRAILHAGNDDDPRLDADFNALTPKDKSLLRAEYARLAPELRNQRGTIVYLIGRNTLDADDWTFFKSVVEEPPCLSLADCTRPPHSAGEEAVGDEVTLAYPALVALRQSAPHLKEARQAASARAVLDAGLKSPTRAVARLAERLNRSARP